MIARTLQSTWIYRFSALNIGHQTVDFFSLQSQVPKQYQTVVSLGWTSVANTELSKKRQVRFVLFRALWSDIGCPIILVSLIPDSTGSSFSRWRWPKSQASNSAPGGSEVGGRLSGSRSTSGRGSAWVWLKMLMGMDIHWHPHILWCPAGLGRDYQCLDRDNLW